MIKSTKTTLKFANKVRRDALAAFTAEFRRAVGEYINVFWDMDDPPSAPNKEVMDKVETWLSYRAAQDAARQAVGIVKGTREKQRKRLWMVKHLEEHGKYKKARRLRQKAEDAAMSKPEISNIPIRLSHHLVSFDFDNKTSFDGWIKLTSLGRKMKIFLPIKKTAHFNRLLERAALVNSVLISDTDGQFCFDIPDPPPMEDGSVLGIDIGQTDALSCSNGQQIGVDPHGHTYKSICEKLARKRKGSKGFARAQAHRTNFLNWCVNQINWNGVSVLQRENIRRMRDGRRWKRVMSAWNYAELFRVLDAKAEERGVRVSRLSPTYTSQRCSKCGYTKKSNRKRKRFVCGHCGNAMDADMNAALNLASPLREIFYKSRRRPDSRTGFFWMASGQESRVSGVQETGNNKIICFQ